MIRVLVADDHEAVRAGLQMLVSSAHDVEVVGTAVDGADAIRQCRTARPDVVLMDVRMPGTDGIAATRAITRERLAAVLVLTTHDDNAAVFGALRAGASGFLLKTATAAEILTGIRAATSGDAVLDVAVTRRVLDALPGQDDPVDAADTGSEQIDAAALESLTPREKDVLRALGSGSSNAQIAEQLVVALPTVKTHVSSILSKLGLSSRVQAALVARSLDGEP